MRFDYANLPEERFEHFKGGEGALLGKMFFDGQNRILSARLPVGSTIGLHTHETSAEIVYILSGVAKFTMDGETEIVTAGQAHYCPKGHQHMLENGGTDEVTFFAVVPEQ